MEYSIESDEGGKAVVAGKTMQENVPKHRFMPLPLILKLPGNQQTRTVVWAVGPETEIEIPPLPMKPDSVELDPDWWILSEKTETKKSSIRGTSGNFPVESSMQLGSSGFLRGDKRISQRFPTWSAFSQDFDFIPIKTQIP